MKVSTASSSTSSASAAQHAASAGTSSNPLAAILGQSGSSGSGGAGNGQAGNSYSASTARANAAQARKNADSNDANTGAGGFSNAMAAARNGGRTASNAATPAPARGGKNTQSRTAAAAAAATDPSASAAAAAAAAAAAQQSAASAASNPSPDQTQTDTTPVQSQPAATLADVRQARALLANAGPDANTAPDATLPAAAGARQTHPLPANTASPDEDSDAGEAAQVADAGSSLQSTGEATAQTTAGAAASTTPASTPLRQYLPANAANADADGEEDAGATPGAAAPSPQALLSATLQSAAGGGADTDAGSGSDSGAGGHAIASAAKTTAATGAAAPQFTGLFTAGASNPASATLSLSSPVGSQAWTDELGTQITYLAHQRIQSATLQLHPADMGPIAVRIEMQGNQASLQLGASHAETRAAMEQSLPHLREMFSSQGLQLTDASVSGGSQQQQRESSNGSRALRGLETIDSGNAAVAPVVTAITTRSNSLIDTWA